MGLHFWLTLYVSDNSLISFHLYLSTTFPAKFSRLELGPVKSWKKLHCTCFKTVVLRKGSEEPTQLRFNPTAIQVKRNKEIDTMSYHWIKALGHETCLEKWCQLQEKQNSGSNASHFLKQDTHTALLLLEASLPNTILKCLANSQLAWP